MRAMEIPNYTIWGELMGSVNKKSSDQPQKPYLKYGKDLSEDEIAKLDNNLISFIELLIKLDKQQKKT